MSSDIISSEQAAEQAELGLGPDISSPAENNPTASRSSTMNESATPCLQLKGSLIPMTVLEMTRYDPAQFEHDLRAKVSQAPDFFENLPIVISLEKLREGDQPDFTRLLELCQQFSIRVAAIRGGPEALQHAARQAGLGTLAAQKERPAPATEPREDKPHEAQKIVEKVEVVRTVVETQRQISKVVHTPIRSGQQVYAADGDLIILASVSAGAEILADGNIHVYGTLRGRALAGVKGDTNARIFCQSMAAELISVAGQYKINEDLDRRYLGKPMQVYLEDDALKLAELEW